MRAAVSIHYCMPGVEKTAFRGFSQWPRGLRLKRLSLPWLNGWASPELWATATSSAASCDYSSQSAAPSYGFPCPQTHTTRLLLLKGQPQATTLPLRRNDGERSGNGRHRVRRRVPIRRRRRRRPLPQPCLRLLLLMQLPPALVQLSTRHVVSFSRHSLQLQL